MRRVLPPALPILQSLIVRLLTSISSARSSWPCQPKCLKYKDADRDKQFWRISDRSSRPERIQNNIHPLACLPLRKASSCLEGFCIVALMLLLPAPKFKPGGSASAASRTRPMHRARGRSRQNINTCTGGARTQLSHKQAIEAAFLNEIGQLRP
jgi:hypothetical protein